MLGRLKQKQRKVWTSSHKIYQAKMFCWRSAYDHLREQYIQPYYYRRPSVYKFTLLMKNTGLSTMKKLGKFVSEAFLLRKSLLNNT